MKTLVVISDSHRNREALDELDVIFSESDYIIHLGDTSDDGGYIRKKYPDKTIVINGNSEFSKLGEDEKVLQVENVKIFMCHGHLYSVKSTLLKLLAKARELGCSLALYGHTHFAIVDNYEDVLLINPGSLSKYDKQSYAYIVINGDKIIEKIVTLR